MWSKFKRHPAIIRGIFHVILIILVTTKCFDWNIQNAGYSRAMRRTFTQIFGINSLSREDSPYNPILQSNHMELFTFNDTVLTLEEVLYNYLDIGNRTTANIKYATTRAPLECIDEPMPMQIKTYYWDKNSHTIKSYSTEILTTDDLDDFFYGSSNAEGTSDIGTTPYRSSYEDDNDGDNEYLRGYFESLVRFQVHLSLCNIDKNQGTTMNKYNIWKVIVHYDFVNQVYLDVKVDAVLQSSSQNPMTEDPSGYRDPIVWTEIFVLVFGGIYCVFVLKDIFKAYSIYIRVRAAHAMARVAYLEKKRRKSRSPLVGVSSNSSSGASGSSGADGSTEPGDDTKDDEDNPNLVAAQYDWSAIPTGIKRGFHCYWSLLTLLAIIFAFADSIHSLQDQDDRPLSGSPTGKFLLGMSALLIWTSLLQFFYYYKPIYAFAMTLQTAIPRVLAFATGFVPIYLAFVFMGMALFGDELGMFNSFSMASKSMFSFMNGDSMQPILVLMTTQSYWASVLYGVSLMLVGAYLLLNILIAIVEEAYFLARRKGRTLELIMWKNLDSLVQLSTSDHTQTAGSAEKIVRKDGEEEEEEDNEDDEWIQKNYAPSPYPTFSPMINKKNISITLGEEAAEKYILGDSHWEYSKIMDFVVEHIADY